MAPNITDRPIMADYGVPDDLDGVLPWSWAEQRLRDSIRYWVATASAEGRPHAMPVWGVWRDDPDAFWFSCGDSARKARNLRANPGIAVTGESATEVVCVEGTADGVAAGPGLEAIVDAYVDKYADQAPGTPEEFAAFMRDTAFFRMTPQRAFGVIETPEDFGPRATRWRWEAAD